MGDDGKLAEIRARIDEIDRQLQALITERARCAQAVARYKAVSEDEADYYRPEREARILRTVVERNEGPLPDEDLVRLFREIMSACLALQRPMKVAYLGPEGTFTQAAVFKHFGHSVQTVPLGAIDEVFREVAANTAHYGVVPIENSTEGAVSHTLDMFMVSNLKICSEVELRIHHNLLSRAASLSEVRRIYAHQMALAQCREWLDAKLPQAERVAVSSNAEGARLAAEGGVGSAAIAGETAAEIYGLRILAASVEDEPDNTTRFLVIGRHPVGRSGADKTSLLLSAQNRAGTLYRLLVPFVTHEISLTRIESRPSRRAMWEYVFFVDLEGHVDQPEVAAALAELQEEASLFKVLGSYPKAVL